MEMRLRPSSPLRGISVMDSDGSVAVGTSVRTNLACAEPVKTLRIPTKHLCEYVGW